VTHNHGCELDRGPSVTSGPTTQNGPTDAIVTNHRPASMTATGMDLRRGDTLMQRRPWHIHHRREVTFAANSPSHRAVPWKFQDFATGLAPRQTSTFISRTSTGTDLRRNFAPSMAMWENRPPPKKQRVFFFFFLGFRPFPSTRRPLRQRSGHRLDDLTPHDWCAG